MRVCRDCLIEKPLESFAWKGSGQRKDICKVCHADREWARRLKKEYGIIPEDYDRMFLEQGGVCLICKEPPSGRVIRLAVDHNHETGQVRGLLCVDCNNGIGRLGDSIELLESAIEYLSNYDLTSRLTPGLGVIS